MTFCDRRRRLLRDQIQEAREGLNNPVKHVLDNLDSYPGVQGLLADFIDADQADAALVEAALGPNLELLLLERTDDVDAVATGDVPGRVRLISARPLDAEAARADSPADAALETSLPAGARSLESMVRVDPAAQDALRRLVGRTVVVDDLNTAMVLAAGPLRGWRFVTRGGEILEPDGRIVVGRPGRDDVTSSGWLTRRAELAQLTGAYESARQRMDDLNSRLENVTYESQRRAKISEALQASRRIAAEAQHRAERSADGLQRLRREQTASEQERTELARRLDELSGQRHELATRVDELGDLLTAKSARIAEVQARHQELFDQANACQERLAELNRRH